MKRITLFLTILFALLIPTHAFAKPVSHSKVILITVDGVRWQEIFNGTDQKLYSDKKLTSRELLPNLYNLFVDHGMVIGRNSEMDVSGSTYLSMPGYLEIIRGHSTTDCFSNICSPIMDTSIIDYVSKTRHTHNIGIIASWDKLARLNTSKDDVVNTGRSVRQNWRFADNITFPKTFEKDDRPDSLTKIAALTYYSHSHPDFLWVALQDTDNFAHYGSYDGYIHQLQSFDQFVSQLAKLADKDTTIIITTDHGRGWNFWNHSNDVASKRVWMMIKGPSIPGVGFVDLKRPITSSYVYSVIQSVMR